MRGNFIIYKRQFVPLRENAVSWEKSHSRNAVLEQVAQRGMAE
jgi:hypothetical protein